MAGGKASLHSKTMVSPSMRFASKFKILHDAGDTRSFKEVASIALADARVGTTTVATTTITPTEVIVPGMDKNKIDQPLKVGGNGSAVRRGRHGLSIPTAL